MAQVIGRKVVVGLYNESTYGVSAGLTSGEKAPIKTSQLTGTIAQIIDETLSGYRGLPQSIEGNKDVSGAIVCNLAPQSCGKWLKHLLGLVGTVYAVAARTSSNITGVEVLRAQSTSSAGAGTLAFLISGTTLSWAEQGDTAGTPVNIAAGGDFTLASNNGKQLFVRVTAGLIPAGNQNDTITVGAGTTYEHVFNAAGAEAVGMTVEIDYGPEMTTDYRYQQYNGVRVTKGSFKFGSNGFVEATYDLRGANFSNTAGAPLDATLDDYGHTGFSMFRATLEIDGAVAADVQEATIDVDNDSDDTEFVIGNGGVRGALTHGFQKWSGSVNTLFKDSVLLNKALAGSVSALRIHLYNGTGNGTLGNEAITFRVPDLKFEAKTPPIAGPKGVKVSLNFNGHRPQSGETRAEVALRTTRAAGTF
jgi:hypothetical protein